MDRGKYSLYVFFILLLCICRTGSAQSMLPTVQHVVQPTNTDSLLTFPIELTENDLDNIPNIQSEYVRQNKLYAAPIPPSQSLLRFLNRDKLEMSEEALYWARMVRDASTLFDENMTFKDTIIVNPLFLPLVFKSKVLPDDYTLYDVDFLKRPYPYEQYSLADTIFEDYKKREAIQKEAIHSIVYNHPEYFRYSLRDLPGDIIKPVEIKKEITDTPAIAIKYSPNFDDVEAPVKFIPERQYWTSGFESAIQFSQNYISPNWHKGGSSNLNLFTKNHLRYDYKKDKIQFTNFMDLNVSTYTAPKDTLRNYKIGDDLLRFHSNFGYKAYNKWYYTFDVELKTQLFRNYKENSEQKQAAFLAPYTINLGLGMKYDLEKKFTQKGKNLKLNVNMAPISYKYMYSRIKDDAELDLGRHGFKKKKGSDTEHEHVLSQFGSTINANFTFNFNRNVSWQSRIYYFTSYDRVEAEFENTLVLAISRFFSTRIYCHLRFDDGATKSEDFDSYFQINELLSFGFNYKW